MVFHPSHRPLEIATRFPQFHSPDDDDISPTNKKHKGTLLSSYRGGHFYWALTPSKNSLDNPSSVCHTSDELLLAFRVRMERQSERLVFAGSKHQEAVWIR